MVALKENFTLSSQKGQVKIYFFKKISLLQENLYSLRLTSSRILRTFIIKLLRQIIKVKFYEYERFSFADIDKETFCLAASEKK